MPFFFFWIIVKQLLILSTDSVQLNGKLRQGVRIGNNAGQGGARVCINRLTLTGLFTCWLL
jgi:hypothetical protein